MSTNKPAMAAENALTALGTIRSQASATTHQAMAAYRSESSCTPPAAKYHVTATPSITTATYASRAEYRVSPGNTDHSHAPATTNSASTPMNAVCGNRKITISASAPSA